MSSQNLSSCPSEQQYQALLDEQLGDTSRQLIMQHVQNCARCQLVCESLVAGLEQSEHSTLREPIELGSPIDRVLQAVKRSLTSSEDKSPDHEHIEPSDLLALGNEFQLLERLGQGSQGIVYRARDLSLHRDVVIKLLAPKLLQTSELVERFEREARSLASIQSPYVVPIFRVGELPSGKMFMVMELVRGSTLRQIQQSEKISIKQVALIAKQVAIGLAAVHHKKLVHRDIKPENILIDAVERQVRIADFGLAFDCNEEARLTVDGTLAGTPAYMSPEQVLNPQSIDPRSDLYSLGVVLYELLTAQVPFRGTTRMTLLQLVHEDPAPPRTYNELIPKDLETICLRALSKDPAKRFQSAEEFAAELDRFLNDQPIYSRPVGRSERFWRKVKKNPIVSLLVACVALLICIATSVSFAYAIHYRSLKDRAEQSSLVAKQQRDSALNTLVDLVFQLQQKFDSDEIYIDEIQQSSLEIAMRGLEDVEGIAGFTNEGGLAMAVALRRLGQTLDRMDESTRCLEKSEQLLRQLLLREPRNQQIVLAMADTVMACDEYMDNEEDTPQLDRFALAVAHCRAIASDGSAEVCEKYATLLTSQARCLMQNDLVEKAIESLREAEQIVNAPIAADGTQQSSLLVTAWEVQMYHACALRMNDDLPSARSLAAKTLEQIAQSRTAVKEDARTIQVQLCCFELLGCLSSKLEQKAESKWIAMYSELKARLQKLAETDGQELAVESEVVMMLVGDRVNEGRLAAAIELLTLRIELAEARLAILPQDNNARSILLDSQISAADIELQRGSRRGDLRAIEHCFNALACTEKMIEHDHLTKDDWGSLTEAVHYLLEGYSALRDGDPRQKTVKEWALKIQRWTNDEEQARHADIDELKELGEMCAKFCRSH